MKIKICGLKSLEDIEIINEVNIDYAGFIFAEKSKRKVDKTLAKEMKKKLNSVIKTVGVFVNADISAVIDICEIIDVIQLHGDEDENYIKELKKRTDKEIIKSYKANNELENNIKKTIADYILIDSDNKNGFGGTGETFDWSIIPKTPQKIFLAGGLNYENIKSAIDTVKPYCVDINSGVETNGIKDEKKIKEIVNLIRNLGIKKGTCYE